APLVRRDECPWSQSDPKADGKPQERASPRTAMRSFGALGTPGGVKERLAAPAASGSLVATPAHRGTATGPRVRPAGAQPCFRSKASVGACGMPAVAGFASGLDTSRETYS